jgi:hypothetical protein
MALRSHPFQGPGPRALTSGMTKAAIGSGWATWSHGYTGAVYWAAGLSQTVTLPPGAQCFYLATWNLTTAGRSISR